MSRTQLLISNSGPENITFTLEIGEDRTVVNGSASVSQDFTYSIDTARQDDGQTRIAMTVDSYRGKTNRRSVFYIPQGFSTNLYFTPNGIQANATLLIS